MSTPRPQNDQKSPSVVPPKRGKQKKQTSDIKPTSILELKASGYKFCTKQNYKGNILSPVPGPPRNLYRLVQPVRNLSSRRKIGGSSYIASYRSDRADEGVIARTTVGAAFVATSIVGTEFITSLAPTISDFPIVQEAQQLFDQYRFEKIEIEMIPQANVNSLYDNNSSTLATGWYVLVANDFDGYSGTSNISDCFGYDTADFYPFWATFNRSIKPTCVLTAEDSVGTADPVVVIDAPWLDLSVDTDIRHFGFVICMPPQTAPKTVLISETFILKATIAFRRFRLL